MTRKLPTIAALGVMAMTLSTGWALAQPRLDQTQLADSPPRLGDVRMVDGKVVDLEHRPQMVTLLTLDNGTSLTVPPEGTGPGNHARIGDTVVARYTDNGTEKVATLVRVIELQAP
jgi:hypothetical protein